MQDDLYTQYWNACNAGDATSIKALFSKVSGEDVRQWLLQDDSSGFRQAALHPQTDHQGFHQSISLHLEKAYELGGVDLLREVLLSSNSHALRRTISNKNEPMARHLFNEAERLGGGELLTDLLCSCDGAALRIALLDNIDDIAALIEQTARRIGGNSFYNELQHLRGEVGDTAIETYLSSLRMNDALWNITDHFLLPLAIQQLGQPTEEIHALLQDNDSLEGLRQSLRHVASEIALYYHDPELPAPNGLTPIERLQSLSAAWHRHPLPDVLLDYASQGQWRRWVETPWPADGVNGKRIYNLDSADELRWETHHLLHCVGRGSYAQKCMETGDDDTLKGRTHIFSIRDADGIPSSTFEVLLSPASHAPIRRHAYANGTHYCVEIIQHEGLRGDLPPQENVALLNQWLAAVQRGEIAFAIKRYEDRINLGETSESATYRQQHPPVVQIMGFDVESIETKLPLIASWLNVAQRYEEGRENLPEYAGAMKGTSVGFMGHTRHFYIQRGKGELPPAFAAENQALHDAQTDPAGAVAHRIGQAVAEDVARIFHDRIAEALEEAGLAREQKMRT